MVKKYVVLMSKTPKMYMLSITFELSSRTLNVPDWQTITSFLMKFSGGGGRFGAFQNQTFFFLRGLGPGKHRYKILNFRSREWPFLENIKNGEIRGK